MDKKIILAIGLLILFAGGIFAWQYFIPYSVNNQNTTATLPNQEVKTPQVLPTETVKDCGIATIAPGHTNDANFNCFIAAAEKCNLAKITVNSSMMNFFLYGTKINSKSERQINGIKNGLCAYTMKLIDSSIEMVPSMFNKEDAQRYLRINQDFFRLTEKDIQEFLQEVDFEKALTDAKQRIDSLNEKQGRIIGGVTNCKIPTVDLVKRLENERGGDVEIKFPDPYCEIIQPDLN